MNMMMSKDGEDKGRPNTMQTGGIIRKMQPDLENTTSANAGGLLNKKKVHYEGDSFSKLTPQKQGWMTANPPTDKDSPPVGPIRTIQLAPSPLENERILLSSNPTNQVNVMPNVSLFGNAATMMRQKPLKEGPSQESLDRYIDEGRKKVEKDNIEEYRIERLTSYNNSQGVKIDERSSISPRIRDIRIM